MAHGLLFDVEYDQAAFTLFGKTTGLTHTQHLEVMAYLGAGDEDWEDI